VNIDYSAKTPYRKS